MANVPSLWCCASCVKIFIHHRLGWGLLVNIEDLQEHLLPLQGLLWIWCHSEQLLESCLGSKTVHCKRKVCCVRCLFVIFLMLIVSSRHPTEIYQRHCIHSPMTIFDFSRPVHPYHGASPSSAFKAFLYMLIASLS